MFDKFPKYYVWDSRLKVRWDRKQFNNKVRRIYHVPSKTGPLYYMMIMFNHIRGETFFEDLRMFDGVIHPTYRDARFAPGLLDDDKEYIYVIKEASFWGSGCFHLYLFSILLQTDSMSRPVHVWESWEYLFWWHFIHDAKEIEKSWYALDINLFILVYLL